MSFFTLVTRFISGFLLTLAISGWYTEGAVPVSNEISSTTIAEVRHPKGGAVPTRLVTLRGTITAFSGWHNSFFLQDQTGGISVDRLEDTPVAVGDEVEVTGTTQPGLFAPILVSRYVERLRKGNPPAARVASYEDLSTGTLDSQLVELSGVVQSASVEQIWGKSMLSMGLRMRGGLINAQVLEFSQGNVNTLVDSTVRLRGVCGSIFNGRKQLVGVRLFVPSLNQVQVESLSEDMTRLPFVSLGSLLKFNPDGPRNHRVRTTGTVTYQVPGDSLYLQDHKAGIRVRTRNRRIFKLGSQVEVFGFVGLDGYAPTLENAIIGRSGAGTEPDPVAVRAGEVIQVQDGFQVAPDEDLLVHVEGKLVERLPHTGGQRWILEQDHVSFQAELGKSGENTQIEPGSSVGLTGICRIESDEHGNPKTFQILLRSRADVSVLRPGGSTVQFPFLAMALVFVAGVGFLIWSLQRQSLEHGIVQDTAALISRRALEKLTWVMAPKGFALLVGIYGTVSLANWAIKEEFAIGLLPNSAVINPAVALAFFLCSAAVWLANGESGLGRTFANWICGGLTCGIGAVSFLECLSGPYPKLDRFLFAEPSMSISSDGLGKMALTTCAAIFLLGFALALLRHQRWTWLAQSCVLLAASLCVLGLNSHVYGIHDFPGIAAYAAMGLKTAICLFLLSLGTLLCYADRGPMRAISSYAPGGFMARRLLPCALLAPSILGWVRWKIQLLGLYDTAFGLALFTSANAVSFTTLIWSSAGLLNRLDLSRSRAEEEIREREEQFRTLLEAAPDAMVMVSSEGRVVMVNAQAEKIFGYSREEILSDTIDRLIPGPFRQQITGVETESSWQMAKERGDLKAVRKDGRDFSVEISVNPIQTARGPVIVAAIRDITVRRQIEAQLLESEERYRSAIESLPQMVWTCGANGVVDYVSRRFTEYTGLSEIQGMQRAWTALIHPDDRDYTWRVWHESFATGDTFDTEYRFRSAAGEYRWTRAMAVPVRDQEGQITRWFGTCTDVEDYKRAEAEILSFNETLEERVQERTAALRDSEERFRFIINGVKDYSMTALDAKGHLTTWNSGAERQNGYKEEEMLGKHFSIFYTREDCERGLPGQYLETAQHRGECHDEGRRVRKDGSIFWADVLLTAAYNEDGTLRGFSQISRDISERKRAEDLLQTQNQQLAETNTELTKQTQRAEKAAKAKSDFLAAMSHEIRTPMNAILAMAEILEHSNLNAEQKQYVEVFRRNGRALLNLINDILDFSKIESGQLELENICFPIASLIRHGTELSKVGAAAKGLDLSTHISDDVPPHVVGDPTRLRQILINLLNNALKFTATGEITVSVRRAEEESPNLLEFRVTDTGIGIPEDKLGYIFEEFTQADSTTTRKYGGTGLGLSICKRLSECMGGRIWVTSVPGKGSTFHFTARLEAGEAPSGSAEPVVDPRLATSDAGPDKTLRILVAEDKADNRLVVQLYMKGLPHTLTFAEDGQQALKLFSENEYDLILMDLQMPVLDGFGSTRAIRALEKRRKVKPTPIVALSADAGPDDKARCLAAGFTDHFAKPIAMTKLLAVVRKYSNPSVPASSTPEDTKAASAVAATLKKMQPKYLQKRRKDAEEILRLAGENNFEQIHAIAHHIKGSGATYGFPDLTRLAAALEKAAQLGDAESVSARSQELSSFIEGAVSKL